MGQQSASSVYQSDQMPCLLLGDILVVVPLQHGSPSDAVWDGYVEAATALVEGLGGVLVVAGNSTITARQRESLRTLYGKRAVRMAVMTDSVLVRGMLTAVRWFGIPVSGFASDGWQPALAWLGREELVADVIAGVQSLSEGSRAQER
jgi:hypothetical protein